MSALGRKRTLFTASLYVRFAPESGHSDHRTACPLSAISRLSHALAKQHLGAATNVIQLEGQHCPLVFLRHAETATNSLALLACDGGQLDRANHDWPARAKTDFAFSWRRRSFHQGQISPKVLQTVRAAEKRGE